MSKIIFTIAFAFICSLTSISQHVHGVEKCATNTKHILKMNDPEYANSHAQKLKVVKEFISDNSVNDKMPVCEELILIPLAIHFQNTTIDEECLHEMALDQIERLNRDFAGTNSNIWQWTVAQNTGYYDGINNKESCIQFCLPTENHPVGYGIQDGDYAITINETTSDFEESWSGYLNCFVRDLGGGLLGYSPLGGTLSGDGVIVGINALGSISCGGNSIDSTYNLGKTMTHVIGHYLFLDHPFGSNNCTEDGDGIADTPKTDFGSFGCPDFGDIKCSEPQLWMSYMDYANDSCLTMFSEGQVDHMEAYVMANFQEALDTFNLSCFTPVANIVDIHLNVMLQGPYNQVTGLMNDDLRIAEFIPSQEPFTNIGYTHVNSGGETITNGILDQVGSQAIVDWIWIEIRDGENPTEIIATKPALLQRDGVIVDNTGNTELSFDLPESGTFLVAIRHLNHLGFRNSVPTNNETGVIHTFNMTDQNQVLYGTDPLNLIDGMMMMISGEGNGDGQINVVDINGVWQLFNGLPYDYFESNPDFNLDTFINAVDLNLYWRPNMSRIEQLD